MRFLTLFAATLLTVSACNTKKSGDAVQQTDSTTQTQPATETSADIEASADLRRLVGEDTGLFRGVNLGDAIADVKAKEKIEQFETSSSHVGYTFEYPNLESTDILYFHDPAGKVNKIDVDLYLNDQASLTRYTRELTDYFNQRFGRQVPNGSETVWNAPAARLVMKDVTKGKNFGLKFTFTGAATNLSASAK
ncbi:hypothetical protein [Tellurirhabdus rosea]|uniref:hypothetical protein n=1 Tax=Tellurirhabdus rosea TaxID=2674997 RepID=UPI00225A9878|nr:hypothetical protein [Tellurirhabdus rosea]